MAEDAALGNKRGVNGPELAVERALAWKGGAAKVEDRNDPGTTQGRTA